MKKLRAFLAFIFLLLSSVPGKAQDTSFSQLLAGIDTTALYDSLLQELRMLGLTGAGRKSFFDVNMGFGNGSFALQNGNFDVQTDHIFYNTGLGYYHKSGLSVSAGVNATNDNGSFSLYQGFVAPSYDFQSKQVGFGVSYFHYFNKENLGFYVSPLVNELYGYVLYKKGWLVPKLAVDYGWGTYDQYEHLKLIDTVRYRRLAPLVRYFSKRDGTAPVHDFSTMLSVRHDFVTKGKPGKGFYFRYTPSVLLLAGTSTYGTNTPMGSLVGPRLSALQTVQYFSKLYNEFLGPVENKFALQNFNISQTAMLSVRQWYVQGLLTFSYLLPKEQSKWNVYFNLSTGISL